MLYFVHQSCVSRSRLGKHHQEQTHSGRTSTFTTQISWSKSLLLRRLAHQLIEEVQQKRDMGQRLSMPLAEASNTAATRFPSGADL
jgi:hypothetical protein